MNIPSLYIHIPFCERKCLFCSFVITVGQEHRREEYVNALISQMPKHKGHVLETIYLGGGTPSMLEENQLEILIGNIRNNFLFASPSEITIEANPEGMTLSKAKFLKELGFNRISLGVQSLNDRYLKFLGRVHTSSKAAQAYAYLRSAGFTNINLDVMYGFPGQTLEELEADVKAIAGLGSEHISLYTLTIEPNSRFFASQMKLDDEAKLVEHYMAIPTILKSYGFNQYEVSNFAKDGFESVHNTHCWRGLPYVGLGVGAHGFTGSRRYWHTPRFQEYLQQASLGEDTIIGYEDLSEVQLRAEKLIFGLRMNEGVFWGLVPDENKIQITEWINDGFLLLNNDRLIVTDKGRLVLDELSSRLV